MAQCFPNTDILTSSRISLGGFITKAIGLLSSLAEGGKLANSKLACCSQLGSQGANALPTPAPLPVLPASGLLGRKRRSTLAGLVLLAGHLG